MPFKINVVFVTLFLIHLNAVTLYAVLWTVTMMTINAENHHIMLVTDIKMSKLDTKGQF